MSYILFLWRECCISQFIIDGIGNTFFFFQKTTTKGRWKRFRWSMALLNFFNIWRGVLQISQMCACRHYIKLYKIWNEKRTFKCEKLPSLSALVNTVPFLDFANPC